LRQGSVGILIGAHGYAGGRDLGRAHAVIAGPDELGVIPEYKSLVLKNVARDQVFEPPVMEGIHLPLDKGVVEPTRHLQTARHIVVITAADLRFPPFLVRHMGVAITRCDLGKGVEKGTVKMGADDADQGGRGGIGHGGRAQTHPPFVRRFRGHDLGG